MDSSVHKKNVEDTKKSLSRTLLIPSQDIKANITAKHTAFAGSIKAPFSISRGICIAKTAKLVTAASHNSFDVMEHRLRKPRIKSQNKYTYGIPNKISWNHSPDQAIHKAIFAPIKKTANAISPGIFFLSFNSVSRPAHKSKIIAHSPTSLHAIGIRVSGFKRS